MTVISKKLHNIVSLEDVPDHQKKHFFIQYPIAIPSNLIYSLYIIENATFGPNIVTNLATYSIMIPDNIPELTRSQSAKNIYVQFGSTNIKEVALLLLDLEKLLENIPLSALTSIDQMLPYSLLVAYRGYAYNELKLDIPELNTESFINSLHPSQLIYRYLQQANYPIPPGFYPSNLVISLVARGIGFTQNIKDVVSVGVTIEEKYVRTLIPVSEAQFYGVFNITRYINLATGNII